MALVAPAGLHHALHAVLLASPILAVLIDRAARVRFVSPFCAETNGVPVEAMLGERVDDLFPRSADARGSLIHRARTTGQPQRAMWAGSRLADGAAMWIDACATVQRGGSVLVTGRDVTATVKVAAFRCLTGIAIDSSTGGSAPPAVARLLLAGYDVTDISVGLGLSIPETFGHLAEVAGVPLR